MGILVRAALAALLLAGGAPARADSVADAEALVRAIYYEGLPGEAARGLDDAGVARLVEMLADPAEAPHHANVVQALGMSGHPRAFEALARYAAEAPEGEVDRATFRARMRIATAMGRLAHDDPRGLDWLLARASRPPRPAWSFHHHRGDALAVLLEEQVLSGLAMTGAPEARAVLESRRRAARGGSVAAERRRRLLDWSLELHERAARDGVEALRSPYPEEVAR